MDEIQNSLFNKEKEYSAKSKKMPMALFCGKDECEDAVKERVEEATCRCVPFKQKQAKGNCVQWGKEAKFWALFGKEY